MKRVVARVLIFPGLVLTTAEYGTAARLWFALVEPVVLALLD